jgi:uncharacterized membrane protein
MYLAQSTRKDSSGEALIGLIDGAQAIVMTLLVIEMPVLIIELVEHVKSSEELFFNLTMDIFGYFLAALIMYLFVMVGNAYSADALHCRTFCAIV